MRSVLAQGLSADEAHRRLSTVGPNEIRRSAGTPAWRMLVGQFTSGFGDAVVTAIWDAFLADLRRWALIAGVVGLVVAGAIGLRRPAMARVPSTSLGR